MVRKQRLPEILYSPQGMLDAFGPVIAPIGFVCVSRCVLLLFLPPLFFVVFAMHEYATHVHTYVCMSIYI